MGDFNSLIQQAPDLIVTYGLKLITALVIFFIGRYLAQVVKKITTTLLKKRKTDETVTSFVGNMA